MQEKKKIANHEDIALKATAQFFRDEIMPMLNIEGKVASIFPTESIHLDLKRGFEDFNYLMEDDSIKHFEFASTNEGIRGVRRFRWYESLTKADLLPLTLTPLMDGEMSQKERISATYGITKSAVDTDAETIRKVEAVVYIMAEKFLETAEMEQLRKEITMTKLGQMIYNDGVLDGEARGEARGELKLSKLITILLKENLTKDIELATSDEKAREQFYIKYGIE